VSLNWREIDAVIAELDLTGSHVQQVIQPDFRNLFLEIFRPGRHFFLRICLETGASRIHATPERPPRPPVRQRFAQLLHARINGARVVDARQLNADRIVRIEAVRGGETTLLWVRLWGGAANCIATDADNTIIDAFFRRPTRNEVSGGTYQVEEHGVDPATDPRLARFTARWETDVNESIRRHYDELEAARRRAAAVEKASHLLESREVSARKRLAALQEARMDSAEADRLQTIGDLIVSNIHRIHPGSTWVDVEDYTQDSTSIRIELNPAQSPVANAETYYTRAHRARRRATSVEEETANLEARLQELQSRRATLDEMPTGEIETLIAEETPTRRKDEHEESSPGLRFTSGGFTILVGRTARENEALLRRHTRGNDLWLHTRDHPGGYVFVKCRPGKSVPLDVLLDAGNLAVHFSKARSNGRADLYYTQVKYLRRAKNGPPGLVLPTHEKNLHVVQEEARLSRLLRRQPA
jgi:predicted ribosome quality control (RQC) complex YloA/Tae2 family protein